VSRTAHVIPSPAGSITIEADALAGLVIAAAQRIDGARVRRPRRGLDVSIEAGTVRVGLELACRFGLVLPELARSVQDSVTTSLRDAAGLAVAAVDVSVEELDP
jgi:uncharacterized alkaline shock family protein YloU